jgi:hypothetical protein
MKECGETFIPETNNGAKTPYFFLFSSMVLQCEHFVVNNVGMALRNEAQRSTRRWHKTDSTKILQTKVEYSSLWNTKQNEARHLEQPLAERNKKN